MPTFSSTDAKNHSCELVEATRIAPVAVTKYDKPFVVIMAVEEYERLMGTSQHRIKRDKPKKRGQ
ncbi:MAG: type II toxin-antitoxin system Phd/YefM family antitoxin [Rhodospirillales bacterium]|nr:type II toxin-antitoxin system Phd/YefM family antitoxin [Rhodospirillales bacterium]